MCVVFCCFCVRLSFSVLCFDICLLFVGRDTLNRQVSAFSHVTRCYAPLVPPEFPNTRRPRGIHTPALRSPKPPRRSLEEASAGSLFARTRWVSKVPVLRGGRVDPLQVLASFIAVEGGNYAGFFSGGAKRLPRPFGSRVCRASKRGVIVFVLLCVLCLVLCFLCFVVL